MTAFLDTYRERFGVEPICRTLGVSASAHYHRATGERSARQLSDERLSERIAQLHDSNYGAYGYRRMWRALAKDEPFSDVPTARLAQVLADRP